MTMPSILEVGDDSGVLLACSVRSHSGWSTGRDFPQSTRAWVHHEKVLIEREIFYGRLVLCSCGSIAIALG